MYAKTMEKRLAWAVELVRKYNIEDRDGAILDLLRGFKEHS